ncbi:MAG: phage holin family protein, partial [Fibrobacter sp.]|nr:phage holin family protein [Fibrobacter sp.]
MNLYNRDVFIEEESTVNLIRNLRDETVTMMRQEVELVKTETSEKISSVIKNSIFTVIWSAVLYAGFLFLLAGLTLLGYFGLVNLGLSPAIASWLMPLITAAVALIVGGIGISISIRKLSKVKPV